MLKHLCCLSVGCSRSFILVVDRILFGDICASLVVDSDGCSNPLCLTQQEVVISTNFVHKSVCYLSSDNFKKKYNVVLEHGILPAGNRSKMRHRGSS